MKIKGECMQSSSSSSSSSLVKRLLFQLAIFNILYGQPHCCQPCNFIVARNCNKEEEEEELKWRKGKNTWFQKF
jgi:hypothetical protein